MRVLALIAVFLLTAWVLPASGQSLASVARKEEARRKDVKQPSRVITNKDLRPVTNPPPPPPPTPDAAPAPDAATPAAAEGAEGKAAADSPLTEEEQRKQDEQNWRKKMGDARLALERSQMYADALQSKINALWADFTARDNPVQRADIELERKRAIAELDRVKAEVEAGKKAIIDLEEEARRAGVPPGWIR
jgi:hypothetical protein